MTAGLGNTIPALPVRDVRAAVVHYRERFGFSAVHMTDDFAVLARDEAILHLWGASDEGWRSRRTLRIGPSAQGRSPSSPGPRAAGSRWRTSTRCSRS
jgi:hypothetical protein